MIARAAHLARAVAVLACAATCAARAATEPLSATLGRSESRVYAAPFPLRAGGSIEKQHLAERLRRLGYEEVSGAPRVAGTWSRTAREVRIFRRAHRWGGDDVGARSIVLALGDDGAITAVRSGDDGRALEPDDGSWLEPEILDDALAEDRAPEVPVRFDALPEHVWRAVLAAEDERFFEHNGIDGRAIARALFRNILAGHTVQGGSTITQQLIKNRDLGPRRTLGRKLDEAARAVWLESEHDKREILAAYLDTVYLGQVGGVNVHGFGAGARAIFSKRAADLSLGEAAALAGMIRSPNRLSPVRHPEACRERRDQVLKRMGELGWAPEREVDAALRRPVEARPSDPPRPLAPAFRAWVAAEAKRLEPRRLERGRGLVVETTIDPLLQERAERTVARALDRLRRERPSLAADGLAAALVALDASNGAVLAYVGGDPDDAADRFDRVRGARRQPGSAVKPLLLLAAFDRCDDRDPLTPATPVADEPLRVETTGGPWEPANADGRFHGVVPVREALVESLNVPFVRIARRCGPARIASALREDGLAVPADPPLSFALGALGVTPLELASAYTVFATPGRRWAALPWTRIEKPSGGRLDRERPDRSRVAKPSSAWLVDDLLADAVRRGTGRGAALPGVRAAGKTGTTTAGRDAWFAGHAGGIVCVVWVGVERGDPGLSGGGSAAPAWREFMRFAAGARPGVAVERPHDVVERFVDAHGIDVGEGAAGARREVFRRGAKPPVHHWWKSDPVVEVVR